MTNFSVRLAWCGCVRCVSIRFPVSACRTIGPFVTKMIAKRACPYSVCAKYERNAACYSYLDDRLTVSLVGWMRVVVEPDARFPWFPDEQQPREMIASCRDNPDLKQERHEYEQKTSPLRSISPPLFFARGHGQHPKKKKKGKGHIRVEHAEIHRQPTLLEYLAGGLQISMTCAIDFTGETCLCSTLPSCETVLVDICLPTNLPGQFGDEVRLTDDREEKTGAEDAGGSMKAESTIFGCAPSLGNYRSPRGRVRGQLDTWCTASSESNGSGGGGFLVPETSW